jgi:hypothetical protein
MLDSKHLSPMPNEVVVFKIFFIKSVTFGVHDEMGKTQEWKLRHLNSSLPIGKIKQYCYIKPFNFFTSFSLYLK